MAKLGSILAILNVVVVAAVLGLFVYTKLIFKPAAITESKERARLMSGGGDQADSGHGDEATDPHDPHAKKKSQNRKVTINLDPLTANLNPFTDEKGKQRTHYVSMTLALEIRSEDDESKFEEAKPVVLDKLNQILVKKKFEDLNQVQGRYLLRSQVIDAANEFLGAPIVTDIYFYDFLLQ